MDPIFPRTSITIDEAVAILLGRINGPIIYKSTSEYPSDEELEWIESMPFSIKDELIEERDTLASLLGEAIHDRRPQNEITKLKTASRALESVIDQAHSYIQAIKDELAKGPNSSLLKDTDLSNATYTYIRRTSFDDWASKLEQQPPKPRLKLRDQEKAILDKIVELGCTPTQLPKNVAGKSGIKSAIKHALSSNLLFEAPTAFNKAWERLRRNEEIAD